MSLSKNKIYFIAIIPPKNVSNEITAFRKNLFKGFNAASEHKKFPHITLQHTFRKTTDFEPEMIQGLEMIAKFTQPFDVHLENFGHFGESVIYISVINNEHLQSLFYKVQHLVIEKWGFTPDEITKSFHPHITLEKKLTHESFRIGWAALQGNSFCTGFKADHLALMKHNGEQWVINASFKFEG